MLITSSIKYIQDWINKLKKEQVKQFINMDMGSYKHLGLTILSILTIYQMLLFSLESNTLQRSNMNYGLIFITC